MALTGSMGMFGHTIAKSRSFRRACQSVPLPRELNELHWSYCHGREALLVEIFGAPLPMQDTRASPSPPSMFPPSSEAGSISRDPAERYGEPLDTLMHIRLSLTWMYPG